MWLALFLLCVSFFCVENFFWWVSTKHGGADVKLTGVSGGVERVATVRMEVTEQDAHIAVS